MIAGMHHENFYVSGSYSAPTLGVSVGWTALKGSFADHQSIASEGADISLIFAGECFPDLDARGLVKGGRHHFADSSSAWLVDLYEDRGERFFEDLNGLFSGLLIDHRQHKVFLFNDRYGMERLYFHESKDALFFASEAKALLRILPESRAFRDDAIAEFLAYGCTLDWKSLFRGVQIMPGGSLWAFDGDQWNRRQYFAPQTWETQPPLRARSFADELEATFARVLPRYFAPDGQVAVSLTGGLDTRMIMACRPETPRGLVSYTFAGADRDTLDVRLAARIAASCHVPHHVIRIGDDFFSDFTSLVDRTVYITDGCFGACGAHEIYFHKQARGLAPIRLTGNFGSEILRGMTTFKPLHLSDGLVDGALSHRTSDRGMDRVSGTAHPVSFAAFAEIPWHLHGGLRAAQSQVTYRTPYMDNSIVALAFRARANTARSSSPALQIVANNDARLARIETDAGLIAASRLRSLVNYPWYRASFKLDYWYSEGMLPHWLSACCGRLPYLSGPVWSPGLHKFLHYHNWFRTKLAGYVEERLIDIAAHGRHCWDRTFLLQLINNQRKGRKNYVRDIDVVLTLDAIDRVLLRQAGSCRPNQLFHSP